MRIVNIALIVIGVACILFGAADHVLQFVNIPYELYIFGILGFILAAIGGIMMTQKGGVVPPEPDPEGESRIIIER